MKSEESTAEAVRKRFLVLAERAHEASGERPEALQAVEEQLLELGSEEERMAAQQVLLKSQDAMRMQFDGAGVGFCWIACLRLKLEARVDGRLRTPFDRGVLDEEQAMALWTALDGSLRGMKNPAYDEAKAKRREGMATWPGVVLQTPVRCDAITRLWIGFHAFANMDSASVSNFSVEGSTKNRSLMVSVVIPDAAMTPSALQDGTRKIPQEGYAQVLRSRLEEGLLVFTSSVPEIRASFEGGWIRLSEAVEEGEILGAVAAIDAALSDSGKDGSEVCASIAAKHEQGLDVVVGSLRSTKPIPGQMALINLADAAGGAMVTVAFTSLLAGTPLGPIAHACAKAVEARGIKARPIHLEAAKPVKVIDIQHALMPCPDGVYRERDLCFLGKTAWRFKRFDWSQGWSFDGPVFQSDEAIRRLGRLPHPIAMEVAGVQDALTAHYGPELLAEMRAQMALPGRCAAAAAAQIRLKDPSLFDLNEDQQARGLTYDDTWFVQEDSVQPPDGVYGAAHWKAANGVLMVAKKSLVDRMENTSIDKGFPLQFVRLPYEDIFVHFESPLVLRRDDGELFTLTGFYACEEPYANLATDSDIERLVVITYTYRYGSEVLRVGGLSVLLLIKKDDERDITDVVAEFSQLRAEKIENTELGEMNPQAVKELKFTNETLLLAAKIILYSTLKDARLVARKDRSQLIEQLRNVKGSKREKLQAKIKAAYDCIEIGPEEVQEDDVVTSLERGKIAPHWRKGYIRTVKVGEGRKQSRPVWIGPVLVNGHLIDGAPPPRKDYLLD